MLVKVKSGIDSLLEKRFTERLFGKFVLVLPKCCMKKAYHDKIEVIINNAHDSSESLTLYTYYLL